MHGENLNLIRQKIIDLYLETKIRKSEEVKYISILNSLFID